MSGWIKRGPTGVIGTNKPDAAETVRAMLEDVEAGRHFQPSADPAAVPGLLGERGVRFVSYDDWRRLDRIEIDRGQPAERPRVKLVTFDEVWQALA